MKIIYQTPKAFIFCSSPCITNEGKVVLQSAYLDEVCWHSDDTGRKRGPQKTAENVEEFSEAVTAVTVLCAANVISPQRRTKTLDSYSQNVLLFFLEESGGEVNT